MKSILGFIIVGFLAYVLAYTSLPWWLVSPLAGLVAFALAGKWWQSLLLGFFGVGLAWLLLCYQMDSGNGGLLSSRMAALFSLGSSTSLLFLSSLLGGLLGGFGALAGSLLRAGLSPENTKPQHRRRRRKKRFSLNGLR